MITKEEKLIRRKFIGGSDVSAILGESKYKTPLDIYRRIVEDHEEEFISNYAMEVGNQLESWLLEKYEEIKGDKVCTEKTTIIHDKYEFLRGNIDGYIEDKKIIVEAKTTNLYKEWGDENTSEVPIDYYYQVLHYLSITNYEKAHIIVFFKHNNEIKIYEINKNDELCEALINKLSEFWSENILKKIPPEPSSLNEIKINYKISNGESIEIDNENLMKLNELNEINKKISSLKKDKENIEKDLLSFIKDNENLTHNGSIVATYKSYKRCSFNSSLFKKENPDLYNQYKNENFYRTFKIKV